MADLLPAPAPSTGAVSLWVATRKGAFLLRSDARRQQWTLRGPHFLGSMVSHVVADPRDRGRTVLACVRTGHLGPTLFRSKDRGRTWREVPRPPRFPRARKGRRKRSVHHGFWLRPGHESQPEVWWLGTSPQGLFHSTDGGASWKSVRGFNDHRRYERWTGGDKDGTPDGPQLHSIQIDPRDPDVMFVGCSSGGVFATDDAGETWEPMNRGCAAPVPLRDPAYGHDPHCVALHPLAPDVLYQQNHCGVYRMDRRGRASDRWRRIGRKLPKSVGDIGFPIALHPRDPDTAWVVPMDGTSVWPRTAPGGKPAVYGTGNGGKTWQRLARGLPQRQAWFSVKRQCLTTDAHRRVGLYFGTSSGEVYASRDEGASWKRIASHLPHVYAVEVAGRLS